MSSSEEQIVEATDGLTFLAAMTSIRQGAHYSICGLTLTVSGIALAISDEQFDVAWDVMNEVEDLDDGSMISLPPASVPSPPEPATKFVPPGEWTKQTCDCHASQLNEAHAKGCPAAEQSSPGQAG